MNKPLFGKTDYETGTHTFSKYFLDVWIIDLKAGKVYGYKRFDPGKFAKSYSASGPSKSGMPGVIDWLKKIDNSLNISN